MYGASTASRGTSQRINFQNFDRSSSGVSLNLGYGQFTSSPADVGYWLFIYTTSPTSQVNQTQYEFMIFNGSYVAGIYQGTQNGFHVTTIHTIRHVHTSGITCYNQVMSGTNGAFQGSPWGSFSGVKIA